MESRNGFNLEEAIAQWVKDNCPDDKFLPDDKLEYAHQLEDLVMERVEEQSLSKKEAFIAVSAHMVHVPGYLTPLDFF